jgi:hypothetical protein
MVVTDFKLPVGSQVNNEKPQLGEPACRPRAEPPTFKSGLLTIQLKCGINMSYYSEEMKT